MDALSDTRRMAKGIHKKNVRSQSHGSSWRKRKGGAMGEIEYGKEPKKPQLFMELWAAKHPGGLVYKRDLRMLLETQISIRFHSGRRTTCTSQRRKRRRKRCRP